MNYPVTYEDDFLLREIGSIATKADVAITELIANAHDAGASKVNIVFPDKLGSLVTVEDNGIGMTNEEFELRWLKLRYDRRKHQGSFVEIPSGNKLLSKRLAFGRNGIGRHAGLCFSDSYTVETWKAARKNKYVLSLSSGAQPIEVSSHYEEEATGHGTKVSVVAERHLINFDELKEIISARFLFNPEFKVYINDSLITLSEHPGLIRETEISPVGNIKLKLSLVDSSSVSKSANQHGVAFWLGGRLLGSPSWSIQGQQVFDGRKTFAKRYTLIAQSDDLLDYVEADWSGFKNDFSTIELITEQISSFVKACYFDLSKTEVDTAKRQVFSNHKSDLRELPKLAQKELYDFVDSILSENPDIKIELLELAFKAAINLEKSRAGISLLHKLTNINTSDVEALDQFLEDWNVSDAMVILAEIDARIKVIEAIQRLSDDHTVDELHTLHPLIERARWVFGPEFDTPEYASNKGLRKTMEIVFKKSFKKEQFLNSAKRPDIVVGESSSVSLVGLEQFVGELKKTQKVLLIELKKGGFQIGRDETDQAKRYVEDIWHAGVDSSQPYIKAYVVGDSICPKASKFQKIGASESQQFGEVHAITFNEMVRTAEARLFLLKENIENRYENIEKNELLNELLGEPEQSKLDFALGQN
ncbi:MULTISPECIES: ATP-binding protein [unclassified Pseudoalteromonas]|uniref:ATP-binding protein n=1 Tax=unclassified Pseudoalteromonas TaxID=194690 RepID=UPI0038696BC8